MEHFYNELKQILDINLRDINDKNIDYQNVILFELNEITKQKTVTTNKNLYHIEISLYYITKENDELHSKNALNILKQLELYNANAIKKMTHQKLIIINANKFFVSKFDLIFEAFTPK